MTKNKNLQRAIASVRNAQMVIITDDDDRENEGDLCLPAQFVSPAAINFAITHARGLVCCAMAPECIDHFRLPLMVPADKNSSTFKTAFTLSVEAKSGITTGISAFDRARTFSVLADASSTCADIAVPGHVFPLRAAQNGVLERRGQTEASVDLCRLAGLRPIAMICEIIDEDGQMARGDKLHAFAQTWKLPLLSVEEITAQQRLSAKKKSA